MKKTLSALMLATALVSPSLAMAREVTISTTIADYYGPNTYLAVYITKPDGSYDSTVWVAGSRPGYYRHLRGWYREIVQAGGGIDGITGASVGPGRTLTLKTDLADAVLNAGYKLHVDTAVENFGAYTDDAVVTLDSAQSGKPVAGSGFIKDVTVKM